MTVQFSFNRDGNNNETLVLFFPGSAPRILSQSHANFENIKVGVLAKPGTLGHLEDADVLRLADAAATALTELRRLSDRVMIKGDTVLFDGDPMENRLTRHLIEMIKGGDKNYEGYVLFLENVRANPSKASRKFLFKFLDRHDLVITRDGCFLGYKGVGSNGKSLAAGKEDVTVTYLDGHVEVHRGHIPYPEGATVEMSRKLVDPNRDVACSVGLHVGNFRYADEWGRDGKLLLVKVNPRDVVSVPSDSNDEKIRAHRFTVIEENVARERVEGTSYDAAGTESEDDGYPEDDWYADDYDDTYEGPVL